MRESTDAAPARLSTGLDASPFQSPSANQLVYACEIKETANGGWRCACGEARQAFQVVA